MMPQNVLSDAPVPASFMAPRDQRTVGDLLVAFELGGVALNNTSEGLEYQVWGGQVNSENQFVLTPTTGSATTVLEVPNVAEWDFTFDQNMNPFFAYTLQNGGSFYYFYNSLIGEFSTTQLPAGSANCRCSLDDKRFVNQGTSDIILSYFRSNALYFRMQRDDYEIEYILASGLVGKRQIQAGLNTVYRYQFEITP